MQHYYDLLPSSDDGKKVWFAIPNYQVKLPSTNSMKSEVCYTETFRHNDCEGLVKANIPICNKCLNIPKSGSFKKRLLLRNERCTSGKRDFHSIRFDYMTRQETLETLRLKTKEN